MDVHYDRDADIAFFRYAGRYGRHVVSEEHEWGLRDLDGRDGRLVGVEIWEASRRLPSALLELLPAPDVAARQRA
jgi:uncharacterized protein YuzE